MVPAKEPGGSPRGGKESRGRRRGSEERVLLCREKVSVLMEKEPFPFCRAALVKVFRAPFISRGLKEEKELKRVVSPSRDIFWRLGKDGSWGIGVAELLCVPERL